MLTALCLVTGGFLFLFAAYAGIASHRENEPRAARLFAALAVLLPVPYLAAGLLEFQLKATVAALLLLIPAAAIVLLLVPTGSRRFTEDDTPRGRIDERDIMFSRRLLEPGTARFEEYYSTKPENRAPDDEFRAHPGLLAKGTTQYSPFSFGAADSTFLTVESLNALVEGEPCNEKVASAPEDITAFLKGWVLKMGAGSVGVTELQDYHKYTVIGRGERYGQPVVLDHDFAVAFTVEMDKEMVDSAPMGSIVMESAQQYLRAGTIAVQVAQLLRELGYPARAHIDANYRVVCPLVARDAGLGEIGRMGLLMTPQLGPRVRIGVVTTDMPLQTDERLHDPTMIDFCVRCKKCADVCPSRAIPFDDRVEIDGVRRWQIDSEACFTLWCKIGTDCGRCVSVCPYSHPDNLLHNLVRRGVRNSSLFRRWAVRLDDVFYGARPSPASLPGWMDVEGSREGQRHEARSVGPSLEGN